MTIVRWLLPCLVVAALGGTVERAPVERPGPPTTAWVDAEKGRDRNPGSKSRPVKTLGGAVALLPEPLPERVTIHVAPGTYASAGSPDESWLRLELPMRPGIWVRFVGHASRHGRRPVLAWENGSMIEVHEGWWAFENLQVGSFSKRQRMGIEVYGPAHVDLENMRFRLRSHSGAGIRAVRGGRVFLRGKIELNEHLHDEADEETFCGIVAEDHGTVKFEQREAASLDMGNGSLSSSYYGCIRLGCATARITSWGRQSNNIAVNNGGRVDLHNTHTILRAAKPENTPIGLEHDGHVLAEGAVIEIAGRNHAAIVLQKASTLTCNDIHLNGEFRISVWAMSGSMFVGRFRTGVGKLEAQTGGQIHIEAAEGEIEGPVVVRSGALVSLPGGAVHRGG